MRRSKFESAGLPIESSILRYALCMLLHGPAFQRDLHQDDPGQVIEWWEKRRLFFNVVVGCTGIITCILMASCALIAEPLVGEAIGLPDPPIFGLIGIFLYGIVANVCYTGGWITELLLSKVRRESMTPFGLKTFRLGVKFSVFVTLCPALLSWGVLLVIAASGQKHAPPAR
jgi:hypothetical protein